jgi:tetratricopeptide (TPR) repeat protein
MKKIKPNIVSLVPYKSNSLVHAKNAIKITNKLVNEQVEFFINQGTEKIHLKDYKGVIESYTKAIDVNPNSDRANYYRGWFNFDLGNYNDALKDLSKAIELNPCNYEAYFYRANTKKRLHDYTGTIEDLTKAIEINATEMAYRIRGNTYRLIKGYKGAIEDYTKVIDLNPSFYYQVNYLQKEISRLKKLLVTP